VCCYFTDEDLATKQFNTEVHCLLTLAPQCSTIPLVVNTSSGPITRPTNRPNILVVVLVQTNNSEWPYLHTDAL